ncbi:hypothetical protein [Nocardia aurea]
MSSTMNCSWLDGTYFRSRPVAEEISATASASITAREPETS